MSQYTTRELLDFNLLESLEDVLTLEDDDEMSEIYQNYLLIQDGIEALRQLPMTPERDQQIYRLQAKIKPFESVLGAAQQELFGDLVTEKELHTPSPALSRALRNNYIQFALALSHLCQEDLPDNKASTMTNDQLFRLICKLAREVSETGIESPFTAAKQIRAALDRAGTGFRQSEQSIANKLKKCLEFERL